MVQFKNVSKVYPNGLAAVKDINFFVDEGEFVFLIGPSGSGKTTLIELLIRDQKPSEGKIYLNDIDITNLSRNQVYKLRRQIGVIFQDFKLISDKNAYENVAFAMEAAGKKNKEIKETVPYVLDVVGLGNRMDAFPVQLSGGEQQRVAIARAIANNPKLLIADEPTGNLDPASAWDIVQILTKINNWGTTVIMSTHGTDIVNTLSKRVIQMERGEIVRDDNEGGYEFSQTVNLDDFKEILREDTKEIKKKKSISIDMSANDYEANDEADRSEQKEKASVWKKLFRRNKSKVYDSDLSKSKKNLEFELGEIGIIGRKKDRRELSYGESVEQDGESDSTTEKGNQKKTKKTFSKKLHISLGNEFAQTEEGREERPDKQDAIVEDLKLETERDKEKNGNKGKKPKRKKDTLARKIENEEKEIEENFIKFENKPVDFLNLPGNLIKDLKESNYKTIGDVINAGPEKLAESDVIDHEEVVLVAKALEELVS
ncbi:MAG: hypothetical protein Kow0081_4390 [Candidatus Dojkabacteria bacterium]